MGLAFREVKPAFAPILQEWLLQSMQDSKTNEE